MTDNKITKNSAAFRLAGGHTQARDYDDPSPATGRHCLPSCPDPSCPREPDPAFAAIERHRTTYAAHGAALDRRGEIEGEYSTCWRAGLNVLEAAVGACR
jgi:hypothetical protein